MALTVEPVSALTLLRHRSRRPRLFLLNDPSNNKSCVFELDLGITEIAGVAGSGKTQLCLGLCCSCACSPYEPEENNVLKRRKPGEQHVLNNSSLGNQPSRSVDGKESFRPSSLQRFYRAIHVSVGEGGASFGTIAERLRTMSEQRYAEHGGSSTPSTDAMKMMERVLTISVRNEDEFLHLIDTYLPTLLSNDESPVGVVVFDSIAGLFRVMDTTSGPNMFARRSGILFDVAAKLKRLSDKFQVPMVVVNQVTSLISTRGGNYSSSNVVPALGVSWSNCVNTSYLVTREERWLNNCETESRADTVAETPDSKPNNTTKFLRTLKVCRSSRLPTSSAEFEVGAGGPLLKE